MEISAKFKDIIEKVEAMSVLELSDLVKVLEEKFGVSAQAVADKKGADELKAKLEAAGAVVTLK